MGWIERAITARTPLDEAISRPANGGKPGFEEILSLNSIN